MRILGICHIHKPKPSSDSKLLNHCAYVGKPSLGVGIEVEMAFHSNKPVVLMYETDKKISRLARGSPAVVSEIKFSDPQDACRQLADFLTVFAQKIKSEDLPPPLSL